MVKNWTLKTLNTWKFFFQNGATHQFRKLHCFHLNETQYRLLQKIFPNANIWVCTIKNWNLNNQNKRHYDLICAMNVFHYAKQPTIWFENVLNACRYFWIQDIINRWRSKPVFFTVWLWWRFNALQFFTRHTFWFRGGFWLEHIQEKIIDFHAYPTKCGPKSGNMNFVCCMKGNCTSDNIGFK